MPEYAPGKLREVPTHGVLVPVAAHAAVSCRVGVGEGQRYGEPRYAVGNLRLVMRDQQGKPNGPGTRFSLASLAVHTDDGQGVAFPSV